MTGSLISKPSVSVVIPTFNRWGKLAQALDSVLQQTLPVDEIIVVDDGSTDDTSEMLDEFVQQHPKLLLRVIQQENRGPATARNAGIRAASGEWIAFLDDDDVWFPDKTERQLAVLKEKPDICLVGCATDTLEMSGGFHLMDVSEWHMLYRNWFLTPGVMVRREVLMKHGGFPEDMHHCEDYALWLKIVTQCKCAFLNGVLVGCGGGKLPFGESGLSADLDKIYAGERKALSEWADFRGAGYAKRMLAYALASFRHLRRKIVVAIPWLR